MTGETSSFDVKQMATLAEWTWSHAWYLQPCFSTSSLPATL